jgi:tRNA(Ile)-lysidine synthase
VSAAEAAPVSPAEAKTLFAGLAHAPAVVLAVSGGPDSTALLVLAARWRASLKKGPQLLAVTVDHGLRPQSAGEARAVKRLASRLGVRHRTLRWIGPKPMTGLPEAARTVRYRLLCAAARGAGAAHVLTAHTLDDQAETVMIRMARGSGPSGLCAMARETLLLPSPERGWSDRRRRSGEGSSSDATLTRRAARADLPLSGGGERNEILLVRPLLDLPKTRLVGTLEAIGIAFADDPSNCDPRFTRARLRGLMPVLAGEGLDAPRIALLARRLRRVEQTVEIAVDAAATALVDGAWTGRGPIALDAERFDRLPAEVALRLLGRAIVRRGAEGPVQLGKLEALYEALTSAQNGSGSPRLRRTLAGALITLAGERLTIEEAPPRSLQTRKRHTTLTKRKYARQSSSKQR